MLNALPVEIVDLVLDKVGDPPTLATHDIRDWERERTLYACCLVCREWRELAQPKLWRKIDIGSSWQEDKADHLLLDAQWAELRKAVEILHAGFHAGSKVESLCSRFAGFERLEEIFFGGRCENFNFGALQALPRLHHLHLADLTIPSLPQNFTLSALVQLVLLNIAIDEAHSAILFSTSTLPALRALSVGSGYFSGPSRPTHSYTFQLSAEFSQQLDMVQAFASPAQGAEIVLQSSTPFLRIVDFYPEQPNEVLQDLMHHAPRHVGVYDFLDESDKALCILKFVQSRSKPQSLQLHSFLLSDRLPPTAASRLAQLSKACREQNVDLIWSEADVDVGVISQEFWAYARKLKAKDAAKRANVEQTGPKPLTHQDVAA